MDSLLRKSSSKNRARHMRCSLPVILLISVPTILIVPLLLSGTNSNTDSAIPAPTSKLPSRSKWSPTSVQPFCKSLVKKPVPASGCSKNQKSFLCPDGSASLFSQYAQDYYVYSSHFAHLKRQGVYADVAANHPSQLSNTFFLDRCLGWRGLCVEANPDYANLLARARTCKLLRDCVSDKAGRNVSFILKGGRSGVRSTNKFLVDMQKNDRAIRQINLTCTTLGRVLGESDVSVIDYMSLDVEGHELMILRGIDWDQVKINVMTIEVSNKTLTGIESFMVSKGYKRHVPELNEKTKSAGLLSEDAVFIHADTVWGSPV